ncbi:MAG: tetratricopeptide repeat protein [Candidatus Omnitrophica bacterium]|jgi:hypothetical protein|nr:tetratricopeptide repeat protein [Candidatus Omnitrophota bacterium]
MKEVIFDKGKRLILILSLTVVAFSIWFIVSYLSAQLLFEKANIKKKPALKSEAIRYYKQIFPYLSKAIAIRKDNSEYYNKKADLFRRAIDDGLEQELNINRNEIENLYLKAIKLNPLNFEYHLKLGLFYAAQGDRRAERELLKAKFLYPKNKQIYIYLCQYFLANENYQGVISSLISYFSLSSEGYWFRAIVKEELKESLADFSQLILDGENQELRLIIHPDSSEFNFEDKDLPQEKILLKIRVYIRDFEDKVVFYRQGFLGQDLKTIPNAAEFSVYELDLGLLSPREYLSNFSIKTKNNSAIDKIEIVFSLIPQSWFSTDSSKNML